MELIVMAGIVAVVLIAQYLVYKNIGLKNVTYKLTLSKSEAFENEEIELIEEIENNKALPLPWVRSEISCSRWLAFYGNSQNIAKDAQKGLVSGIFMLKGHQKLRRSWRVKCEKRGVFRIEDVTLSVSDLFGLVKPAMMLKTSEEICVLPSPSEIESCSFSTDEFMGNQSVRRFILPDPFMICGAKEYTGREPMNRIHWSQSARTGSLMVYNNEFTTERKMLVILNMQRMSTDEKQRLSISVLEAQIKAVAFVLDLCYRSHIAIGFAVNGYESCYHSAEEGYEHTLNILRVLAGLKNQCGCHIDDYLNSLDYSGYTDVVLISNFIDNGIADFFHKQMNEGRYAVFFSNEVNETEFCDVCHVPRTRSYPNESGEE